LAVVILALIVPALILFATFKFCNPLSTVMFASAELKVPAFTVPVAVRSMVLISPFTVRPVSTPTLVMLFKVLGANTPLKVPPSIIPGTVRLLILPLNALMIAALTVPVAVRSVVLILFDTFRLVSVPILVMLGWFAVVILALIVPALILFATFKF
jgi:hypothetical protein